MGKILDYCQPRIPRDRGHQGLFDRHHDDADVDGRRNCRPDIARRAHGAVRKRKSWCLTAPACFSTNWPRPPMQRNEAEILDKGKQTGPRYVLQAGPAAQSDRGNAF